MTPEDAAATGAIEHFEAHGLTEYAWAVRKVLDERDELRRELDEITDLDRTALKTQELRDDRHRAVAMWHDEKKRAEQAEAERDQARQIARDFLAVALMATPGRRLVISNAEDPLPDWLTEQDPT